MKIVKLEVTGFGMWQDETLTLDPQFQLLYGENEAGKSTLYHFIRTILFGFPHKRGLVKDYTPKNQGSYGGKLVIEHPSLGVVTVERIKTINRGKAKVYFSNGDLGAEEELKALLAPLTLELFDEVYSLQQEQLIDIQSLGEDKLQNLLLSIGVVGSQKLMIKKEMFNKEQQQLYKPNGRLPVLNQKIKEYQELQQQVLEKERGERSYHELLAKQEEKQQLTVQLKSDLADVQQKLLQVRQQEQYFPKLEIVQGLRYAIKAQEQQPLTTAALAVATSAYQQYQFLESQSIHYQQLKEEEYQANQTSPALLFYLEQEADIRQAVQQFGEIELLLRERKWLSERLKTIEDEYAQVSLEIKGVATEQPYLPKPEQMAELKELAVLEERLIVKEGQLENAFAQKQEQKTYLLKGSQKTVGKRQPKSSQRLSYYLLLALLVLAGIGLLIFKQRLLGFLMLGVSAGLLVLVRNQRDEEVMQEAIVSTEEQRLDQELTELSEAIAISKRANMTFKETKNEWAEAYQFANVEPIRTWLYHWPARERLADLIAERTVSQNKLSALAEQEVAYRQSLSFMAEWLPVKAAPLPELGRQLQDFSSKMSDKKQGKGNENWHQTLADVRTRQTKLLVDTAVKLEKPELKAANDLFLLINRQQELVGQAAELAELEQELQPYFDLAESYELSALYQRRESLEKAGERMKEQLEQNEKEFQAVNFSLRQQEVDGTLAELYQKAANSEEELLALSSTWMAAQLNLTVLQDLLNFLGTQQLPALLATASSYLKTLTRGHYVACQIEGEQLVTVLANGETRSLNELSTGTRDQLYVAIRLAFIQLHSQDGLAPVIIDDGWLHYDSERKLALFELLLRISRDIQVICLTSDRELVNYVTKYGHQMEQL